MTYTVRARAARAAKAGPQPGSNERTKLSLETIPGPTADWMESRDVSRELIDLLAAAMVARGAKSDAALGGAELIAAEVPRYISNYESWLQESDAVAGRQIIAAGQLAYALRETLNEMGPRAQRFEAESMREDGGPRYQLALLDLFAFCDGLEMAARKVDPPARRASNAAVQDFLRAAVRTWWSIVGAMPTRSSNRDTDEKTGALFVSLQAMVADAAGGMPRQKDLVAKISDASYRAALASVREDVGSPHRKIA